MSIENERLKKLGLNQKETRKTVNVMNEETIIKTIQSLDEMPLNQFDKLLILKPKTIVDKKINVISISDCTKQSECKTIHIQFKILFNYIIGGFRVGNSYFYTIRSPNGRNRELSRNGILHLQDTTLKRKGGIFYMTVNYYHHTTYCESSYISSTIRRTSHSLLIPNYEIFVSKGVDLDIIKENYEILKKVVKEPLTLDNINSITDLFGVECDIDHTGDYHDDDSCEDYDCEDTHYHNNRAYCFDECENGHHINFLSYMLTHPHFFNEMDNFCTGNQFTHNKVFQDSNKYPNPISYIAELIRTVNDIDLDDSYFKSMYMVDVFSNFEAFNEYSQGVNRLRDIAIYYEDNGSTNFPNIRPSSVHTLSLNCYCTDCITFRFFLVNGLKYDKDKLILSDIAEVSKDDLKSALTGYVDRDNISYSERDQIIALANIKMDSSEYYISNKSPLDLLNAGFESSSVYMGIFRHKQTGFESIVSMKDIQSDYKIYSQIQDKISELTKIDKTKFTEEQYEHLIGVKEKLLEVVLLIPEKTLIEYLFMLYEEIKF